MPSHDTSTLCPCGSKRTYAACCGLYISGEKNPPTAEALMRSRYTAYTQANIPYIQATMRGKAAEGYDPKSAHEWAKNAKWRRLRVLQSYPHPTDPHRYYVEFKAFYLWQGKPQQLHEVSEFEWEEGRWYYTGPKYN